MRAFLVAADCFDRTSYLVERGNATNELLDQRRQQLDGATHVARKLD